MQHRLYFSVIAASLLLLSGQLLAGPDDKESVVIKHANGSEAGKGSVEIELSVQGAVAHLTKHEFDCVAGASSPELEAAMKALQSANCNITE